MISFSFSLFSPMGYRFENRFSRTWQVSKNKAIEVEHLKTNVWIGLDFRLVFRQDHAGTALSCTLFGHEARFEFYDVRHWNYEKGCWHVYDSKGERK
jgi:hypothetical protein